MTSNQRYDMGTTDYKIGIIGLNTCVGTHDGSHKVLQCIKRAKRQNLDLLVGPEWSLMAFYSSTKRLSPKEIVDLYAENYPTASTAPIKSNSFLPYSPHEARKLINLLKKATKGSDMVVMPGTMMLYTNVRKLYNVMPIFKDGRLIYSVLKNSDGGSSDFDVRGLLSFKHPTPKRAYSFEENAIKFGIEICADTGTLAASLKPHSLDIQVLSAAGVRKTDTDALKETGFLVCSDGAMDSDARYVRNARSVDIPASFMDDDLAVYRLRLETSADKV